MVRSKLIGNKIDMVAKFLPTNGGVGGGLPHPERRRSRSEYATSGKEKRRTEYVYREREEERGREREREEERGPQSALQGLSVFHHLGRLLPPLGGQFSPKGRVRSQVFW